MSDDERAALDILKSVGRGPNDPGGRCACRCDLCFPPYVWTRADDE